MFSVSVRGGDAAARLPGPGRERGHLRHADRSAARRFDDLAVLTGVTLGFALGTGTIEASKHLPRTQAGAAVGTTVVPELRTLRARLAALADG